MISHWHFFRQLLSREIRGRFIGSFTGLLWVVIQPLVLLAIYAFVFTNVLKVRIPEAAETGFVAYLAVAMWPWIMFADSLQRSTLAVTANAALIGKVAVPRQIFTYASVTSLFILHLVGYVFILLALQLTGTDIHWLYFPVALIVVAEVFLFAMGLGLMFSALQVYVRDLEHILPPVTTVWFFATPIIYSLSMIPEYADLMHWNPFTHFVQTARLALLEGQWNPGLADLKILLLVVFVFWAGKRIFTHLSPSFEDFF